MVPCRPRPFRQAAHTHGVKIRPVGRFISPNGIAQCADGECMVSLGEVDKILAIDKDAMQVRCEAGVVVETLLEALAPHGMTLANFSSIKDQQVRAAR